MRDSIGLGKSNRPQAGLDHGVEYNFEALLTEGVVERLLQHCVVATPPPHGGQWPVLAWASHGISSPHSIP